MKRRRFALPTFAILTLSSTLGCKKENATTLDAGPAAKFVPAPSSELARELGANDAGCGEWSLFEDGPNCGTPPRLEEKKATGKKRPGPRKYWELGDDGDSAFLRVVTAPRQLPDRDNQAPVRLRIATPIHVKVGAHIDIETKLINTSPKPLVYARMVDGSRSHWRSPYFDVYVKEEASGDVYRWVAQGGWCGNLSPRTPDDFNRLEPGKEAKNPFGEKGAGPLRVVIDRKGRFTLWVVYAACQGMSGQGHSDAPDAPLPPDTFEGDLTSNGVGIDVD